jgi:hypothetical protein
MIIMYDDSGRPVSAHRDHDSPDLCHEFVWFRTNLDKPFFMLDPDTGEKLYVRSHAAWFDTVNQYHGADGTGGLSFSIRVDGRFSADFRRPDPLSGRQSRLRACALGKSRQGLRVFPLQPKAEGAVLPDAGGPKGAQHVPAYDCCFFC